MPKDLVIIAAQPDDLYFAWQIETQIINFRKYGLSDKLRYLMFLPGDRLEKGWNPAVRELPIKYPEVQFYWYEDKMDINALYIRPYNYVPLLRPYCLINHFRDNPDLKDKAILYMDSDVIFLKDPSDWINKYKDDDINYLSDTKGYIAASYWDSKIKDVKPERLEDYKAVDPLNDIAKQVGIDRATCESNEDGSGGAQYLLKNIDYPFWSKVFKGCLAVRGGLSYHVPGSVNNTYFEDENKGFQSWCADMWSVLWNLWKIGAKTVCPPEMNFVWATSHIDQAKDAYIMHNAGATSVEPVNLNGTLHKLFYKAKHEYINNILTPFDDNGYLGVSPQYCSSLYAQAVKEAAKEREFSIIANN